MIDWPNQTIDNRSIFFTVKMNIDLELQYRSISFIQSREHEQRLQPIIIASRVSFVIQNSIQYLFRLIRHVNACNIIIIKMDVNPELLIDQESTSFITTTSLIEQSINQKIPNFYQQCALSNIKWIPILLLVCIFSTSLFHLYFINRQLYFCEAVVRFLDFLLLYIYTQNSADQSGFIIMLGIINQIRISFIAHEIPLKIDLGFVTDSTIVTVFLLLGFGYYELLRVVLASSFLLITRYFMTNVAMDYRIFLFMILCFTINGLKSFIRNNLTVKLTLYSFFLLLIFKDILMNWHIMAVFGLSSYLLNAPNFLNFSNIRKNYQYFIVVYAGVLLGNFLQVQLGSQIQICSKDMKTGLISLMIGLWIDIELIDNQNKLLSLVLKSYDISSDLIYRDSLCRFAIMISLLNILITEGFLMTNRNSFNIYIDIMIFGYFYIKYKPWARRTDRKLIVTSISILLIICIGSLIGNRNHSVNWELHTKVRGCNPGHYEQFTGLIVGILGVVSKIGGRQGSQHRFKMSFILVVIGLIIALIHLECMEIMHCWVYIFLIFYII